MELSRSHKMDSLVDVSCASSPHVVHGTLHSRIASCTRNKSGFSVRSTNFAANRNRTVLVRNGKKHNWKNL